MIKMHFHQNNQPRHLRLCLPYNICVLCFETLAYKVVFTWGVWKMSTIIVSCICIHHFPNTWLIYLLQIYQVLKLYVIYSFVDSCVVIEVLCYIQQVNVINNYTEQFCLKIVTLCSSPASYA